MAVNRLTSLLVILILIFANTTAMSADSRGAGFGGPDAVDNLIEDDARQKGGLITERITQPWFDWKQRVQQDHGLALGADYSGVYFKSSDTGVSGEDKAAGGILRIFGSWDLVGRGTKDTGAFVWKLEHRHKYTDISPQAFSFDQGILGLIEPPFSDQGTRFTNLYWRQRMNNGQVSVIAGFLDTTDYVDVFALASPWTGFLNFAFSTGTTTIFIPNDATLGVAAGAMLSDKMYIIGGLTNAYSDPTAPFDGVNDFFKDNEYFTSIELGWTKSQDRIYLDNTHLTLWHVDESKAAGTPGGWGAAFQYVTFINNNLVPFVRAGYADNGGTLMQKSLSVGLGYQKIAGRDLLGVAFNWGEPNDNTFAAGLKEQKTFEVFYRFQLAEQFALTPDIQYIKDPALNPNEDQIWVVGLRARLAI